MPDTDCFIVTDEQIFRYRAAAIIHRDNHILMAGSKTTPYLYSIGGAVHINESAQDAVIREVLEETGVLMQVDRLLFIHENFFAEPHQGIQRRWHELAFFFLMKPDGLENIHATGVNMRDEKEFLKWVPFADFKPDRTIFPDFLPKMLLDPTDSVRRVVSVDEVHQFL